jgi:hypothetical protein
VDTITEFELVLPNGEVKIVTEKDEDLWFALKVGSPSYVYGSGATISFPFHTKGWIQQLRELCKVLHYLPNQANDHLVSTRELLQSSL